ncbi:hypothetical protein GH733_002822 [Mirounga leonina]|nr:hypothetical protein GH733_002822 [Mirounga leonina]
MLTAATNSDLSEVVWASDKGIQGLQDLLHIIFSAFPFSLGESKNVSSEQEPTTSKDDQDSTPVKPCYLNILENEQPLNSAVQKDIDSSKQPNPLPLP